MGLREILNRNPAIVTGGTVAVIVIAVGFIIYSQMGSSAPKPPSQAFYSVDDGTSYFADDVKKTPPFDHEGKPAYKAHVYKCADGKPFVGYLERYTPEAKKKLDELKNATATATQNRGPGELQSLAMAAQMGTEIKRPGESKWTRMMDFQNSTKIMQVTCPDGNREQLEALNP